ncbi:MAG TPA: sulfotransferase domain-containing protein [Rhizomicrobium sp.]|jgi:hypothetical protein|nr:sulfotransferase domain-containing protein [Rhizomicrobium sp.]
MKVSFMVAGVQKAGTTAMYENLRLHSDIGMPRRKEPHFFDRDEADWAAPNYDILHRLYEPGRAIYGESTPITIYWTSAHERIRAYNPDIRFILLFRDPVERAYSHWCMQYARGAEKLSFAEAIRRGRQRIKEEPRRFSYVERGFYGRQTATLHMSFQKDHVLSLMSDDFLTERASTLAKVAEFVGVDSAGFASDAVFARARKPMTYPSIVTDADRGYLQELYANDLELFAKITNLDIGRWQSGARCIPSRAN